MDWLLEITIATLASVSFNRTLLLFISLLPETDFLRIQEKRGFEVVLVDSLYPYRHAYCYRADRA